MVEEVIPKAGKVYVMEPKANGILPLLNLSERSGRDEQ
jgi:hypothetical protein